MKGKFKRSARLPEFPVVVREDSVSLKIYHTPTAKGYDSFTLVYRQDGTRKREVFGDLGKAKKRGKQVATSLAAGQLDATRLSAQDWQAFVKASEHIAPTGLSLESACKEFAEAFQILDGKSVVGAAREYADRHRGTVTSMQVRDVITEFLAAKRDGRSTRFRGNGRKVSEKYLYQLERQLEAFSARFHMPISLVRGSEINRWIDDMDVEGRTKNNYVQAVRVLFEFAKKQRYLPKDHTELDVVERVAESDFTIDMFSVAEMKKLLANSPEALVPVLAIGAFAGLRTAEIERLDWSEVDLRGRHIEVKAQKAKTRARRLVPVTANLRAWLKPLSKKEGKVWPHCAQYLFELQREAAEAAEVKWKHNALRHSFISYRLATLKSVDQVALEAGNSPQMIFQHYRELVTPAQAKAWFGVNPTET